MVIIAKELFIIYERVPSLSTLPTIEAPTLTHRLLDDVLSPPGHDDKTAEYKVGSISSIADNIGYEMTFPSSGDSGCGIKGGINQCMINEGF